MAEKNLNNIRIVNKHDTEDNWLKATGFTPKQGELIVYDIDENYNYERIKIGDGVQNVNDLPFYASSWEDLSNKPFGSVEGQDYIVEEQSIVLGNAMGGTETYVSTTRPFSEFIEDQVYYIVFDGEVYPAEYDSDLDGLSVDAVDLEIYYGGNDEITVFTVYSDPRKGETHTFGMYVTEIVTAQLDEKYIPDTIARISDIPITNTSLSVAGVPADAKATGDAIREISTLVGDKSVSEQINTAAINNQSDWSVNDETSPAYVKNRTHWLESEYIKFIDNETIPFILASEGLYASDSINNDVVFIEGNTYTFTIDGTSYDCVAHIVANYGYTYIGNVSYLDPSFEDTQEPFCVLCYNNAEVSTMLLESSGIQIATTFEGDSHAISLSGLVETYHKIDRKYLPHLVGRSGSEEGAEIFNNYNLNIASGGYAHAEGSNTTAEGWYSHAEGNSTSAVGTNAHAEGSGSYAEGINSHAEGSGTTASGYTSHAEGYNVVAASEYQHAQGKFNIEDANDIYAHIVGNGTNRSSRSNAHTISWDGIGWFANSVKIGGTGQDDEAAKELATKEYVDSFVGGVTVAEQIDKAIQNNTPKIASITLLAASWTGDTNPWSQVVTVNGVTANSKVDLQPTAVQIVELQNNEITLMIQNDDGVVTAWAIGNKPTQDYTMQVLITEVVRV